jgi:predicted homoserine dehydrogenase-like protein
MNLHRLLQVRADQGCPVRVGVIGAGKFSSMFMSQARLTPGMHVVGIAELDPQKARQACLKTGWAAEDLVLGDTTAAIEDGAAKGKTAITGDARQLISARMDVILEITGVPEAGAQHAWWALESGKHVVMVNVEADALLGPVLAAKAEQSGLVYSMAYGDQPALIAEQIDWARAVGLEVVCAGKGTRYQPEYHYSTPQTVWGHYGFSEERVASGDYNAKMFNSFLDGTKSAIEMCAVANGSGLVPQACGLRFPPVSVDDLPQVLKPREAGGILDHAGTVEVVASENRDGSPVPRDLRWGVYVVFRAPTEYVKRCFSEYGLRTDASGEFAAMYRPYHLIGLELGISVASAALRGEPTGSSRGFIADVGAAAKKDLQPGEVLDGEGGYTVYGRLVGAPESLRQGVLPMGLASRVKIVRPVPRDALVTYADVAVDESLFSYKLRRAMEAEAKKNWAAICMKPSAAGAVGPAAH